MELVEKIAARIGRYERDRTKAQTDYQNLLKQAQAASKLMNKNLDVRDDDRELQDYIDLESSKIQHELEEYASAANETSLLRAENLLQNWTNLHSRGLCAAHRVKLPQTMNERLCPNTLFTDKLACLLVCLINVGKIYSNATPFYSPSCLIYFHHTELIKMIHTLEIDFDCGPMQKAMALKEKLQTINSFSKYEPSSNKIIVQKKQILDTWYKRVMHATRTAGLYEVDYTVNDEGRLIDARQTTIYSNNVKKYKLMHLNALMKEDLEPLERSKLSERLLNVENNRLPLTLSKKEAYQRGYI